MTPTRHAPTSSRPLRGRLVTTLTLLALTLGTANAAALPAPPDPAPTSETPTAPAGTPAPAAPADAGESTTWLVEVDPTHDDISTDLDVHGIETVHEYDQTLQGYAIEATPEQVDELTASGAVLSVEPDQTVTITATSTQDRAPWGLDRLDQATLPLNGTYTYPASGGAGVRVYVVDTGIDATHPDFQGRVAPGFSAINDGVGTADCHGHGTHVAGTVASRTYGVAKAVTVVPVRVLPCAGSGDMSDVIRGLDWVAANHPAGQPGVVNMSLAGGHSEAMTRTVDALTAQGILVVAAAGNSNADACQTSPAHVASALTLGASAQNDSRAPFSNWGPCLDAFAPGVAITSTTSGNGIGAMSGTSMAAPHAAGLAALLLADAPTLSPQQVTDQLLSASTPSVTSAGASTPNLLLGLTPRVPAAPPKPAAPAAPTKVTGSALTTTTMTLSWSAPTGAPVTGYTVQRSTNAVTWSPTTTVTGTTVRLTALAPATKYHLRVAAVGPGGTSTWAQTTATTAPRPSAVRSATITTRTPSTVGLSWAAPATSATRVTDYRIEHSRDGRTWTTYADGVSTKRTATVAGLAANTIYTFRITAIADGTTAGAPATVRARTYAAPSAARSLKVTARTPTTLSLSWLAPTTSGAYVTDYRIQYSRDGRTWTTLKDAVSPTRTASITGLAKKSPYTVRVLPRAGTAWATSYVNVAARTT